MKIDTAWAEARVRKLRRWRHLVVACIGVNAFSATSALLAGPDNPVQMFGVTFCVAFCVYGWHVAIDNERIERKVREALAEAYRLNALYGDR